MFDRKNDTRQGDRLADKLEAGPDGGIDSCLAAAIEALETYGHHHAVCAMRMKFQPGPLSCTCGYDPKLRALKEDSSLLKSPAMPSSGATSALWFFA